MKQKKNSGRRSLANQWLIATHANPDDGMNEKRRPAPEARITLLAPPSNGERMNESTEATRAVREHFVRTDFVVPIFGTVLQTHRAGRLTVRAFSVGCVEGEVGPEVRDAGAVFPISAQDFNRAAEAGWAVSDEDIEQMIGRKLGSMPTWRFGVWTREDSTKIEALYVLRKLCRDEGAAPPANPWVAVTDDAIRRLLNSLESPPANLFDLAMNTHAEAMLKLMDVAFEVHGGDSLNMFFRAELAIALARCLGAGAAAIAKGVNPESLTLKQILDFDLDGALDRQQQAQEVSPRVSVAQDGAGRWKADHDTDGGRPTSEATSEARPTKLVLPTPDTGDASKYLGLPPGTISWKEVDRRLQEGSSTLPGGSSLAKLVTELGLDDNTGGK